MKKILIPLMALASLGLFAQKSQLNQLFDKYSGKEGYTSVYITKYMFDLFAEISNEQDEKEFREVTSNLNAIKILIANEEIGDQGKSAFTQEVRSILPQNEYKEMMVVKEGPETITFLVRENQGRISELVMTLEGGSEQMVLFLEGDISLKDLSKLSQTMNVEGFEHLEKIDDEKK
jgi:hypothetical protein